VQPFAAAGILGLVRRLVVLTLCLALAACASQAPPPAKPHRSATGPRRQRPAPPPVASTTARMTLVAYLDATLATEHARAWGYISSEDREKLPKDAYVKRERANDRLRAQVRALGPTRYSLESVREKGNEASAIVVLRSGLGSERVRFVLKREGDKWFVVYDSSWGSAD
jgi:hypothetical protein